MRFRDIIGQESVKQQLRLSVQEGRVPHARLFTGKEGVGKLPLAIAYSQYLNCENRTDEDSCGVCPTCLQFSRLQHPDLHFAFPIVKTDSADVCDDYIEKFRDLVLERPYFSLEEWYEAMNTESKQAMIYEKESGEIIRKLSLKTFGSGYKVMIIWQSERMNDTCANKLLKLLEEPPERTVFLLISEHPELLLSTIISRVQITNLPLLTEQELAMHFPQDIAHIAQGSYLNALRMTKEDKRREKFFNDFVSLMRNAWCVGYKREYGALMSMRTWSVEMAAAKQGREYQKDFLQYAQQQIRENYILNFGRPQMNYQKNDEAAFSKNFHPFINDKNVQQLMDEFSKAEKQISQNCNAKFVFFDLCLQLIVLIKNSK